MSVKKAENFFLPYTSNSFYPFKLQYFKLNPIVHWLYDNSEITRQFRRLCRKLIQYICKDKVLGNERIIDITLKNSAYYEGFFQSDAYFKDNIHLVFEDFRIKDKYRKAFTQKYGDFFAKNKVIVIHFRRKDYNDVKIPELSEAGISLPIDYYRKSLSMIENIEHYKILFIGDDLESVERDFGNNPNYLFENNEAIVDFQLIQNADIAIIANSTFAWWAAYLNEKSGARIIAPKYWLGFKGREVFPAGIETSKFEWIEFTNN